MTLWIDPPPLPPSSQGLPGLHPLVSQALTRRGITDEKSVHAFIDSDLYLSTPANELPGMDIAVKRIIQSIQAREPVCVWGDFDVDGQTSTTVLVESLQAVGANVSYHIPVRQTESHGVNIQHLARVIAQGAKLVVTCDTGISAVDEVNYARSRGVDMVITDHHDLPDVLPDASAVVDPKMLNPNHPLATLAGVGVAYKLAEEIITRMKPQQYEASRLLDLAGMGLVADLAILRGDARHLVQKGLAQLRKTERLGLRTIMELAELSSTNLTEEHISFGIAPRLNAIGRLGNANPVVELLTTSDPVRTRILATQLEALNVERKLQCEQVYQAAEAQLRANPELLLQPVIVLAHPTWPGGIVGIVASRIVERYHKPAILMTAPNGQPVRGSARSIEGVNITAAISAQKDLLLGFGGHPMAAGLSLEPANFIDFKRRLYKTVDNMLGDNDTAEGRLEIDGWINFSDANLQMAEELEKLAPFGPGNPKLTLASHNLTLQSATKLGKNKEHLKLTVSDEFGNTRQVLWWDGGSEEAPTGKFDLAYSLRASDWRGSRQEQLEFVDFRLVEPEKIEIAPPKREVRDYRNTPNPLETFHQQTAGEDFICWAEAGEKKQTNGEDRNSLTPAKMLVIWTTPPSPHELARAIEKVNPEVILVFGVNPGPTGAVPFLERLAGLVKFVQNKKAGKTSLAELAGACATTETAIQLGLKWLAMKGKISLAYLQNNEIQLSNGENMPSAPVEETSQQLLQVLEEINAYRQHFQQGQAVIPC